MFPTFVNYGALLFGKWIFNKFRTLKKKPDWGNHFWARGYCVDTVGIDADEIPKCVKYQEEKECKAERSPRRLF